MSDGKVRLGIAGSGYMALTYAETTTKYNKGAHLVAIAAGRRAPALAKQYGVDVEDSVAELVLRKDIDAVILAVPEQYRLEYTVLAAAAGKHVLSEKPMAPTVVECTAMIEACRAAGVTLMVCQTARYRGIQVRAKQLIDAGRIGAVWMMRSLTVATQATTKKAAEEKSWITEPASGGFFYDMGVHVFDMMRWLSGQEPRRAFAFVNTYSSLPWPAMSVFASIEFDGGAVAQHTHCMEMPDTNFPDSTFRFQITGDKGLLEFESYNHLDLGVNGRWERIWTQPEFDYLKDPKSPVRLEAHADITQEFVNSILEERQPAVTGEDGRAAVAICQACTKSAETAQMVEVNR